MSWLRFIAQLAIGASVATGFAAAPSIDRLEPHAIAPRAASQLTLIGANLDQATALWTSFDAKVEKVSATSERAVFKIMPSRASAPALGALRVYGTNGVSNLQLLLFDSLPTISAAKTNHSSSNAQLLKLPVAVEGAVEEKASTFFKFNVRKGERIWFDTAAQRLGSALDPLIRLLDTNGHELFFCEDTPGAGVDARFSYQFSNAGTCLLELRDTKYGGDSEHFYRLRLGQLSNEALPWRFSASKQSTAPDRPLEKIILKSSSSPQKISWPVQLEGTLMKPKQRDLYSFDAKKGDRLLFRGKTRHLGSPCDLYMAILDASGKRVVESPLAGEDDTSLTNSFKESGSYQLIVEDAAQLGGPEYLYQIDIRPLQLAFSLSVETDKVQASPGGSFEIKVLPTRVNYDGAIRMSVESSVAGFVLEKDGLTAKTNSAPIKITIPQDLQPGQLVQFKLVGHAKVDGREFSTLATTRPAFRKAFPHLLWFPDELDGWITLGVTKAK